MGIVSNHIFVKPHRWNFNIKNIGDHHQQPRISAPLQKVAYHQGEHCLQHLGTPKTLHICPPFRPQHPTSTSWETSASSSEYASWLWRWPLLEAATSMVKAKNIRTKPSFIVICYMSSSIISMLFKSLRSFVRLEIIQDRLGRRSCTVPPLSLDLLGM